MSEAQKAMRSINIFKEMRGHFIEDLEVGMTDFYSRTITEADIVTFAGVSGDLNPIHLNQEFAEQTQFAGTIAHGMLTAALISTVVGTRLPGPGAIYMSQNLRFTAPVKAGDTITAVATVRDVNMAKRRCALEKICLRGDEVVVTGDALLLVPTRAVFGGTSGNRDE